MTAPMIPTVSPNVSSQVVAQQAQPQTSELAKFLMALRAQQDAEARTQIQKIQADAQMAEMRQRQSALDEAARLAEAQRVRQARVDEATQAYTQALASGDRAPTTVPMTSLGSGGMLLPFQVPGQDALQAAIAGAGSDIGDVLQNKGVQDMTKAALDARAARETHRNRQTVVGNTLVDSRGRVIYAEEKPSVDDNASKYAFFVMGLPPTTKAGTLDPRTELPRYQDLVNTYRRSGTSSTNIDLGAAKGFLGQIGPELFADSKVMQGLVADNRLVNRALRAIGAGAASGPGTTQIKTTAMLLQKMTGKRDVTAEETAVLENALLQRVLAYSATRPLAGSQSDAEGKMIADAKAGRINYNSLPALVKILLADRNENRKKVEGYKSRINRLPESSGIGPEWREWLTKDLVEEEDTGTVTPSPKPGGTVQSNRDIPYNGKMYTPYAKGNGWFIKVGDQEVEVIQ